MTFTDWWNRFWSPPAPEIDTSGLDAVTRRAGRVTRQFDHLVPTTSQENSTMSTPTPEPGTQADVDYDVSVLTGDLGTLAGLVPQIQQELAALPASIDTTALDGLVAQAADVTSSYSSLVPANPTPTPDPTTGP